MKNKKINIFFVQNKDHITGSFKMRAIDIKDCLYKNYNYYNITLINKKHLFELETVKDKTIFIFIKPTNFNLKNYKILKQKFKNFKILLDCIDFKNHNQIIQKYKLSKQYGIDGFIFCNKDLQQKCYSESKYILNDALIHHHADIPSKINKFKNFNICYYGASKYKIKNITNLFITKHNFEHAAKYPCHCSYRNYKFKPNTKISFAANCKSNIIINKQSGGVYTLPKDYSYICNDDLENLFNMIEYVKEDFESREWFKNIEIMEWYRNEYSLNNIIKNYNEYFLELL